MTDLARLQQLHEATAEELARIITEEREWLSNAMNKYVIKADEAFWTATDRMAGAALELARRASGDLIPRPELPTCPTCGSSDPKVIGQHNTGHTMLPCRDSFHDTPTLPEGVEEALAREPITSLERAMAAAQRISEKYADSDEDTVSEADTVLLNLIGARGTITAQQAALDETRGERDAWEGMASIVAREGDCEAFLETLVASPLSPIGRLRAATQGGE